MPYVRCPLAPTSCLLPSPIGPGCPLYLECLSPGIGKSFFLTLFRYLLSCHFSGKTSLCTPFHSTSCTLFHPLIHFLALLFPSVILYLFIYVYLFVCIPMSPPPPPPQNVSYSVQNSTGCNSRLSNICRMNEQERSQTEWCQLLGPLLV